MTACTSPWFAGLTVDHLYADCPNRQRGLPELARFGWDELGGGRIDPHGTDVCGMCRHRHDRAAHPGVRDNEAPQMAAGVEQA